MKGFADIEKNLEVQGGEITSKVRSALYEAAIDIERTAIKRTPKKTGNLRNSYHTFPTKNGATIENTADYALYVHENMEAHHKTGQAKFLETAIDDNIENTEELLSNAGAIE